MLLFFYLILYSVLYTSNCFSSIFSIIIISIFLHEKSNSSKVFFVKKINQNGSWVPFLKPTMKLTTNLKTYYKRLETPTQHLYFIFQALLDSCRFGHIYWRKSLMENFIFCAVLNFTLAIFLATKCTSLLLCSKLVELNYWYFLEVLNRNARSKG